MKPLLWTIALVATSVAAYGQRTEFSVQAGSGLFSFYGPGAVNEVPARSVAVVYPFGYTFNPFSRAGGPYYELTIGARHVTNSQGMYGLQMGYEAHQSKVAISGYRYEGPIYDYPEVINEGITVVRNRYVNLQPFVGKRLHYKRFDFDVTTGLDVSVSLSSREKAVVSSSAGQYTVDTKRPLPIIDFRPRLNLTGYYRAFGLSLGYSHGLTNYSATQPGDDANVYSRMWRVGVAYRLGKSV